MTLINAIVGAWVDFIGGVNIIGIILGIFFLFMLASVFYKITN